MTRRGTWWAFWITLVLTVALVVVGTLHVATRWVPRELGTTTHGNWMEFDSFRLRVDMIQIVDSLPARYGEPITAETPGMKLMMVRFSVERQTPAPEELFGPDDAVCNVSILSDRGLEMDQVGYGGAVGPSSSSCYFFELESSEVEWGDELNFTGQIIAAVPPQPASSFTIRVERFLDDGSEVWFSTMDQ